MRRVRYVFVAAALSLLVSFPNLLSPVDLVTWTIQAKLGHSKPSGNIVFVEVPDMVLTDDDARERLRRAVVHLQDGGARSVFLDLATSRNNGLTVDENFRRTVTGYDNLYVVGRVIDDRNEGRVFFPAVGVVGDSNRVIADHKRDFLGFVWRAPVSTVIDGQRYDTFSKVLSGTDLPDDRSIEISYHYDARHIPVIDLDALSENSIRAGYANGKSFVFGYSSAGTEEAIDMPGSEAAPRSYVAIFAAETIWGGGMRRIGVHLFDYLPFLGLCIAIVLTGISLRKRGRRLAYLAAVLATLAVFSGPIFIPFRTGISAGLAFLAIYAIQCVIFRWRAEMRLESAETGLPTLQRLERDIAALPESSRMVLIAAKIHNFSEVMATLPAAAKREYFKGIVKRLRVGDTNLHVYSNSGDRLLWLQEFESQETTRSHLVALMAIFKNPLRLNDKPLDISITFGADFNFLGEAHRRIGLAEALTDRTSLSAQPIIFGDEPDGTDGEWRVSLQSKIDAALGSDEIFAVFQPQIDLRNHAIVGFEGLVRWHDKERGYISPSYFVEQCEQAGRMEKLQRFMLKECITKFQASKAIKTNAWLSINVSATLLADTWLTELVAETLEETGFPAPRLVLEITETARIHDHKTASAILTALANLGVGLSLDDFGTGSAGLENFFRLPFSELKVDRLFTASLTTSHKAEGIVQNAINLGNDLGVRVICEGVEDRQTLDILTSMGCEFAQGYLFGEPRADLNSFENSQFEWLRTG